MDAELTRKRGECELEHVKPKPDLKGELTKNAETGID